jgi:equilibrative nucleoside transporter 1/2/3
MFDTEPLDKAAYAILFLLGLGSLFPWNAFITPVAYWRVRLTGSIFAHAIESSLTTSFTFTSLLTIVALQPQPVQQALSLRLRIVASLLLSLVVFGILASLAAAPLTLPAAALIDSLTAGATAQFVAITALASLSGIAQAAINGALMSYASLLGSEYFRAVSGGQGLAGLTVSLSSLLLGLPGIVRACEGGGGHTRDHVDAAQEGQHEPSLGLDESRDTVAAAAVYFCGTVGVLCCCLLGFFALERLPFTCARKRIARRHAEEPAPRQEPHLAAQLEEQRQTSMEKAPGYRQMIERTEGRHKSSDASISTPGVAPVNTGAAADATAATTVPAATARLGLRPLAPTTPVWRWAAAMTTVYTVSIAIFPAFVSSLAAAPGGAQEDGHEVSCVWQKLFGPLLFVAFNTGDLVGRNLPVPTSAPRRVRGGGCALSAAALRVLFAPLFMMCRTESGAAKLAPGLLDRSDAAPLLLTLLFGLTNGQLTTSIFVSCNEEREPVQRSSTASLLVVFLFLGIFLGAALSFLFAFLDCTPAPSNAYCNPFGVREHAA